MELAQRINNVFNLKFVEVRLHFPLMKRCKMSLEIKERVNVKQMALDDDPTHYHFYMMTSSNGNIFRVTGPFCGEFTGHRWIPHTKASDAELWCFLWSAPEKTVE